MKKFLIVLVVLVGFAGTAMSQTKVGHVKSQVLWDTLQMSKSAETQLLDFQKSLQQEIQALGEEVQKLYLDYQKIMESPNTSTVIRQRQEQRIQEKEAELQKLQQNAQFELQAFRAELEGPIEKLIRDAVAVVAKRDKYDYIMDVNSGLYVNPEKDLTEVVMKELLKLEKEQMAATPPPADTIEGGNQ